MIGSSKAPRLLHRKEVAVRLNVSLSWLDKSRLSGEGPPFIKLGNRVLYHEGDLEAFVNKNRRKSTSGY